MLRLNRSTAYSRLDSLALLVQHSVIVYCESPEDCDVVGAGADVGHKFPECVDRIAAVLLTFGRLNH